jgi:hypothetical protein
LKEPPPPQKKEKKFTALFTKATIICIVKIVTFYSWFCDCQGYHNYLCHESYQFTTVKQSARCVPFSNSPWLVLKLKQVLHILNTLLNGVVSRMWGSGTFLGNSCCVTWEKISWSQIIVERLCLKTFSYTGHSWFLSFKLSLGWLWYLFYFNVT